MNLPIKKISNDLLWLKENDVDFEIFGSQIHQYLLGPVINEQKIVDFEKKHSIKFPDDYRKFITILGGDGAGPEYGLMGTIFDENQNSKSENLINDLSKPFLLNRRWDPDVYHAPASEDESWYDAYWDDHWVHGTIIINHFGCGNYTLLVLKGPAYGTIWYDCRNSNSGIIPSKHPKDPNQQMSFSEWYLNWLNKSCEKIKSLKIDSMM